MSLITDNLLKKYIFILILNTYVYLIEMPLFMIQSQANKHSITKNNLETIVKSLNTLPCIVA